MYLYKMNEILAVSTIDGRYSRLTKSLKNYFSEHALFKYRLFVECEYFIKLCRTINITIDEDTVRNLYSEFTPHESLLIKAIEENIKHDVKSVELFMNSHLTRANIGNCNLIHFALTSQDINNVSVSLSIKDYLNNMFFSKITDLLGILSSKSNEWRGCVMIGRTHGQPAVPTTMGKEFRVFHYRLTKELDALKRTPVCSKFGGAVGNFNAHYLAYPDINWTGFGNEFLEEMGLQRNQHTTQIDNYESLAVIFDNIKRINTILVDLCRDIWTYISNDYLKQQINPNEVGSSTMPQKVNPINFENAEGNLLLSISMLEFLSRKLPVSRLQRDLTDSTVLRNLGTVFGWCEIAYHNIAVGLEKINVNREKLRADNENNLAVLTEGYQTLLRKWGDNDAYKKLKDFSRTGTAISQETISEFIAGLEVTEKQKQEMLNITVENYIGNSKEF